jgi:hypothetical protein
MKTVFVFAIGIILSSNVFAAYPHYTLKRATSPIIIDGVLNEEDWAAAAPCHFAFRADRDSLPMEKAEGKLLWDDEFLYLAVKCEDKHITVGHAKGNPWNSNTGVSADDCVELFWNTSPSDTLFYQFEINCVGIALSKLTHKRDRKTIFIMPPHLAQTFEGTVNKDDDEDEGWIMEIAVRFSDYPEIPSIYTGSPRLSPKAGDTWRINLNRVNLIKLDGEIVRRTSQWSPTVSYGPRGSFHAPLDFGYLHFSNEKVR